MTDKTKLTDMLDNIIGDNNEQAQVDFHAYLADKMRETLHGEDASTDTDNEE